MSWQPSSLVSASSRLATLTVSPIAVSETARPVAHLADDGGAEVEADAHAKRLVELGLEVQVQPSSASAMRRAAARAAVPPAPGPPRARTAP
jgi:hypothetical protein